MKASFLRYKTILPRNDLPLLYASGLPQTMEGIDEPIQEITQTIEGIDKPDSM